jgi:DUF2934 family protein
MATSKTPRKPAPGKSAAKPAAPRRAAPKAPATPEITPEVSDEKPADLAPDELRRFIAEAAYFRAQKRGFTPGYELQDWVEAEAEVRRLIGRGP